MARIGVTYNDIIKASEIIKLKGLEPTVDRVREHLGTGSKSTIAPLLKRWKSNNLNSESIKGIPSDLVEVVKSLYERTQYMANKKIESAQADFNLKIEKLKKELKESYNMNTELNTKNSEKEKKLLKANDISKSLNKELEILRIANAKNIFILSETDTQIEELKSTVIEQKQENSDIRDHFEHYQQHTANDRQIERDQNTSTNKIFQDQIVSITNQLNKSETQNNSYLNESKDYKENISKLKSSNASLKNHLGLKELETNELTRKYNNCNSINDKLNVQNDRILIELNSIKGQHLVSLKEVDMLGHNLITTQLELEKTNTKIEESEIEYKTILQEKGVLQGQLKQLN
ncbi:MAG: DNA-binding protein, partial [Alcanivoracaceae bacterium]|nr:DNA-binding protein [Alcanivoracaceae bacterium]